MSDLLVFAISGLVFFAVPSLAFYLIKVRPDEKSIEVDVNRKDRLLMEVCKVLENK